MNFEDEEDEEEDERPVYSVILQEEDYETEDDEPQGLDKLPDNFESPDPTPEIKGWDPRESWDFFRIQ